MTPERIADLRALCEAGLARYDRWEQHDPGPVSDTEASRVDGDLMLSFQQWCLTEVPDVLHALLGLLEKGQALRDELLVNEERRNALREEIARLKAERDEWESVAHATAERLKERNAVAARDHDVTWSVQQALREEVAELTTEVAALKAQLAALTGEQK